MVKSLMSTYRLNRPLVGIPLGTKTPITVPAGTLVEQDGYLQSVGLTVVFIDGRRVTVMSQDFLAGIAEKNLVG